jgi:hypothetical protein
MRGLVVAVATATVLLAGTGTALADTRTTGSRSEGPVCTKRIPAVLDRIDRLTERIGADAGTRGSTAWLQAKAGQARDAGFTALADLLDSRAAARGDRVAELAELKTDVQDAQRQDCAP